MAKHPPTRIARSVPAALVLAVALGAASAAAPPPARAQSERVRIGTPHRGGRPMQLDLHLGFTWYGRGLATGARFGIPIVDNGFVPSINDAVYINFGLDLYFVQWRCRNDPGNEFCGGTGIGIPVTMHWEFYFTPQWTAFGEVGVNPYLNPGYVDGRSYDFDGRHWFIVAVGGRYMFDDAVAITLRIGSPYASFGVSFFF